MKNERGITLIALIIYVVVMTFVVAGISAITTSFYSNMNSMDKTSESAVAFSRFNMYFLNDIKSTNVKIQPYSGSSSDSIVESSKLTLSMSDASGNIKAVTYSMRDDGLYRDQVKVCDKLTSVKFTTYPNKKNLVIVNIKFRNYEKTTSYILEPRKTEDNTTTI